MQSASLKRARDNLVAIIHHKEAWKSSLQSREAFSDSGIRAKVSEKNFSNEAPAARSLSSTLFSATRNATLLTFTKTRCRIYNVENANWIAKNSVRGEVLGRKVHNQSLLPVARTEMIIA